MGQAQSKLQEVKKLKFITSLKNSNPIDVFRKFINTPSISIIVVQFPQNLLAQRWLFTASCGQYISSIITILA